MTFHEGELAVQRRAGVQDLAAKVGAGALRTTLTEEVAAFLAHRFLLVAGVGDPQERMWASPLVGPPGFAAVVDAQRLALAAAPHPGDPLERALDAGLSAVGLLALESSTRSRVRVNGTAGWIEDGIGVRVHEVFGNCPKYIQRRHPRELLGGGSAGPRGPETSRLDAEQSELVRRADTFFIASRHAERGADASHRGGAPGFVVVSEDGTRLSWGDYAGNNMFQTLGNLTTDPACGLLFVDWENGTTLQITGRAEIVWEGLRLAAWPGAQRLLEVTVEAIVAQGRGLPVRWDLIETALRAP